ncbi:ubiquitin C-terminal hydrolase Ubp8 [Microsporum canis CBS 113480]|uniref:Ubiquitin carboxyl-terminal hydrolase n=1 Tax=Arthroderma otae (strain ATCC MYA-4605 / CBS 113480) TaxID=554155 RepID=C5FL21_ARTOC|nr:ubiquitin C-terminal hydrolase Ubp8 [Microsporum canis CBS 113480]EEQ30393.1 ubiquitin C-terminal hydrolase Ubp8 [Microsporum canis CBS 113480]
MTTVSTPLYEPAYGCEHLQDIFENDTDAATRLAENYAKLNGKGPWNPSQVRLDASKRSTSGPKFSLKPQYQCLQCPAVGVKAARCEHSSQTGHIFFADYRSKNVFCQGCDDLIYDVDLESILKNNIEPIVSRKRKVDNMEDDEYASYIALNTNKKICGKEGVRGLFNLGQTCYMNVILQTLFHEPVLTAYFLGNGHSTSDCQKVNCFGCALADAFAEFSNEEKDEGFGALNLLLASWQKSSDLAGYHQQDAHEFYQFLVNQLHESTSGNLDCDPTCRCFFHTAFFGKLRSTITCGNCGKVSRTEDPVMDVSLDLQVQKRKRALGGGEQSSDVSPTLQGCLEGLRKLPVILCMQLKRFERNRSVSEKVETKVSYPASINMMPYTTRPRSHNRSQFQYDLLSVVVHIGDIDSGHYLAYCRHGEQWFKFNDDRVTVVAEAEVLGADAYLLFYTLQAYASCK